MIWLQEQPSQRRRNSQGRCQILTQDDVGVRQKAAIKVPGPTAACLISVNLSIPTDTQHN